MLENAYKSHHKTLTSHRAAFLVISCNLNTAVTTTQDHRHWLSAGQLAATWAEGTSMAWPDPPPVSSFPSCLCRGLTALLLSLAALNSVCQAIAKGSCKFRCRERGVWVEDVMKFWGALKSCFGSHRGYMHSMDCTLSLTWYGLHRSIPAVTIAQPWAMALG